MIILDNVKLYDSYKCIDINNNFPLECNLHNSYTKHLLDNTKSYDQITNCINIQIAYYFIYPWETDYQHWIIEQLPRFIDYYRINQNIPILITKDCANYIKEFLADFCVGKIIYVDNSKNYLISKLNVSKFYNVNFEFDKLRQVKMYTIIKNKYNVKCKESKYVYITNNDIELDINNNLTLNLDNYFRSIGCKVINIDKLSFRKKVELFLYNNIITLYNKNLASSVFSNGLVDTIFHPKSKCKYYWRIVARRMGFKYNTYNNIINIDNSINYENLLINFNKYSNYNFLDKIYIITLRSVQTRVDNVLQIINSNPNIKMFNAIDKQDLIKTNDFLEKYLDNGWISRLFIEKYHGLYGKICCKLSHTYLWWYCYSNKLPYIIVLEDDIKLVNNFNKNISLILEELGNNFYFINLYIHPHYKYLQTRYSKKYPCGKKTVSKMSPQYGNVAYIINYKLCEIIFNNLEIYNTMHNDVITENLCKKYPKEFYVANEIMIDNIGDISYKDYKYNKKNKLKSSIWIDYNENIHKFF